MSTKVPSGLGCAEKKVSHPYLGPLDVGRRAKGLTLNEHLIEGVKILVVDLSPGVVKINHPVSGFPWHLAVLSGIYRLR
jgi:hypothetical protein